MNPVALTNKTDQQALINRVKATLKGEDPVIRLLDNRMRDIFRTLVTTNPQLNQQVPTTLKSGRGSVCTTTPSRRNSDSNELSLDVLFKRVAREEFVIKGFAFYSNDLAEASLLAHKTIKLILNAYGHHVLDKMFVSSCEN